MRRTRILLACSLLGSCGRDEPVVATSTGDEAVEQALVPFRLLSAGLGPYVRVVTGGCTEGVDRCGDERPCDAVPVDCAGDTRVRITANWASSDGVDVYVSDPSGDVLSFLRPVGVTGGRFHDTPGRSCVPGRTAGTAVAEYLGRDVLEGTYKVVLHHFGGCMSGLGSVDIDLTLSAAGRHLASYRATLAPSDRLEALTLSLGP